MLRNLVKLANELDRRALVKEADYVDRIFLKVAEEVAASGAPAPTRARWGNQWYASESGEGGAVQKLQAAIGAEDDGYFGDQTYAKLKEAGYGDLMGASAAATLEAINAKKAADAVATTREAVLEEGVSGATGALEAGANTRNSPYYTQQRANAAGATQDARQAEGDSDRAGRRAAAEARRRKHQGWVDRTFGESERRNQGRDRRETRRDTRHEVADQRRTDKRTNQTTKQEAEAAERGYQYTPGAGEPTKMAPAPVEPAPLPVEETP